MGRKRASFKIKDSPRPKKLGKVFGAEKRDSNEKYCAKLLSNFGYDIIFLPESKISGVHTPDILWKLDNNFWEIKTINGEKYTTIKHALDSAKRQSQNVILYTNKTRRTILQIARDCIKYCDSTPSNKLHQILIVTKDSYLRLTSGML